jgi:hypothetical protein
MSAVYEAIRTHLVEEAAHPPLDDPEAWERALADGGYGYFSEFDIADVLEEHADELEVLDALAAGA